ncbi:MAG TPA: AAA family ATPase [Acidimicrobiales bacterium]|nr:AAA family ATPase [Acidimicrobiales bacterium]
MAAVTSHEPPGERGLKVRLLGAFAISVEGREAGPWPRPSARRLCQLVLVSPGRRVSRDLACEELFAHLAARAAARELSKALSVARSVLGELGEPAAGWLQADLGHIWAAPGADVDVEKHEASLRAAIALGVGAARDEALVSALGNAEEMLADEPYADWAERPRERLEALRQQARLALARDRSRGAGRSSRQAVVEAWEVCLEHDPASEEAAAELMRVYAALDQRHLVVRAYQRCRAALEALGLRPSPSLEEIYAAVAAGLAVPRALAPAPAGAHGAPLREERKVVTVLFAEMAPARAAGQQLDPEDLREVLDAALGSAIAEVEALGGTIASVSGRGLQALFGAPDAHEDDPERAARTALRILRQSASRDSSPLAVRIGIESGLAVVGPLGGRAGPGYGAVGDVVEIAAALQSLASVGSALVGPAARAATEPLFEWGGAEEVTLGNGAPSLRASYLERPVARALSRRPRTAGGGPLVGRDLELSLLDAALRKAEAGTGSVVLLTGEPGLGKSRLVQECRKRFMAWVAAESGRLPLWLEGRCASYASTSPYGLYQHVLANWVGVALDQGEATVRPALERGVVATMGDKAHLPALARVMGLAGSTGPVRMTPGEQQRESFVALKALVSRLTSVGPTVLVLEDLHWADPTSVHLTENLAGLVNDGPLLLIGTARPDAGPLMARLETVLVEAGAQLQRIELQPLSEAAEKELAQSLVGHSAGGPVLDVVRENADGNPLFLEERLSSLVETGALVREGAVWRLVGDGAAAVPQALERLVRTRVDRLSPSAQELVRAASVLGHEFRPELVARVADLETELGHALAELCDVELLQEVPEAPEPTYRFRHVLMQEAIHGGLLRAERRRLHGRAAWALKAASEGRHEAAAVIAHHFAAAGDIENAVEQFQVAGESAAAGFANDEAICSFRSALALLEENVVAARSMTVLTTELWAKLAELLWISARDADAQQAFEEAIGLVGDGDPLLRAHLQMRRGRMGMYRGRLSEAAAAFDAVEALLGDDPMNLGEAPLDDWLEMMVDGRPWLYVLQDKPQEALAALQAARHVVEARGRPVRKIGYYRNLALATACQDHWRFSEATAAAARAGLSVALESGDKVEIAFAWRDVGMNSLRRGDIDQAQDSFERALALAEETGDLGLQGNALSNLVIVALGRHDVDRARSLLPRVLDLCERAGGDFVSLAQAGLVWLRLQEGRLDEVIALARQAVEAPRPEAGVYLHFGWMYLWPLLSAYLQIGDLGLAIGTAGKLLDPSQQAMPDELALLLVSASSAWEKQEPGVARGTLGEALEVAQRLGYL